LSPFIHNLSRLGHAVAIAYVSDALMSLHAHDECSLLTSIMSVRF